MPSTIEGIGVLVFALMPGALYIWAFERVAGGWAIGLAERFFRFLGISLLFHVLVAPVTYNVWQDYLRSGALDRNEELPLWLWGIAIAYVALPIALGTAIAWAFRRGFGWATIIVGPQPAPTAWDSIFSGDPAGWVLLRLKSGRWIGGEYGEDSYSGGYPEPADLFLETEFLVDQAQEDFVYDENQNPTPIAEPETWGVLVRWSEVEYLEVTPTGETA